MDSTENPYSPGAGLSPPEFAGRDSILQEAKLAIIRASKGRPMRSLILLGLRGVGKTVLLNHIDRFAQDQGFQTAIFEADSGMSLAEQLAPQLKNLLLLISQNKAKRAVRHAFDKLHSFARAFKVRHGEWEESLQESATGDLAIDLSNLLVEIGKACKEQDTVAVLLIDELQCVSKEDLKALIVALHKVSQFHLPLLLFGAGLPHLLQLTGSAKNYTERLFKFPRIGKLDKEDSMQALVSPAQLQNVEYSQEALDIILDETEGYPYYLQVWGHYAWEVASTSPISSDDARKATQEATDELDEHLFQVRISVLSDRQVDYVKAMATLGSGPHKSSEVAKVLDAPVEKVAWILGKLIKDGAVYSPKRGKVAFTIPKFDEYLRRVMKNN